MNELALFAGAGGGILGGILCGWRCVCAVEKEPYCREVLLRRQRDGVLPMFPTWDDIRTFDGRPWRGVVDIVTAGFPCQPWSCAGQRKGENDDRNLWPETLRVLREVGSRYVLLENVPGLLAHDYFGEILGGLAEAGYDARWGIVSAVEVGAPHIRKRLWIVCSDTESKRRSKRNFSRENMEHDRFQPSFLCETVPDSKSTGQRQARTREPGRQKAFLADAERPQWGETAERRHEPDGTNAGREEAPGWTRKRRQDVSLAQGEGCEGGGREGVSPATATWRRLSEESPHERGATW